MKQIINRMELRFPSGSVNESFARGAVSAFVLCLDPLVTDLNDLKTAVSEAVTNTAIASVLFIIAWDTVAYR